MPFSPVQTCPHRTSDASPFNFPAIDAKGPQLQGKRVADVAAVKLSQCGPRKPSHLDFHVQGATTDIIRDRACDTELGGSSCVHGLRLIINEGDDMVGTSTIRDGHREGRHGRNILAGQAPLAEAAAVTASSRETRLQPAVPRAIGFWVWRFHGPLRRRSIGRDIEQLVDVALFQVGDVRRRCPAVQLLQDLGRLEAGVALEHHGGSASHVRASHGRATVRL